jgi:hypothetical protein
METSPFLKANNSTSIQGILRILCNSKVHYRVHNSTLIVPILSNINPIQDLPSYLLKFSQLPQAFKKILSIQISTSTLFIHFSFSCW